MAAAIALRGDCDSGLLRELAKQSEDADQVRRLLALAVVYDGGSRSDGARAGGVGLQTFRDWVLRFNAAGPTGLVDGKAPGQAPRLDQAQRDELARLIEDGPVPAVHLPVCSHHVGCGASRYHCHRSRPPVGSRRHHSPGRPVRLNSGFLNGLLLTSR